MKLILFVVTITFLLPAFSGAQSLIPNTNFGDKGLVATNFNNDNSSEASCAALQPDGKIVIGGYPITRVLPNGIPDSSFNGNGTFIIPQYFISPQDIVIQADGKIIAMLYEGILFIRLTTKGAIDSSYGTNGYVTVSNAGGNMTGSRCVLQADGKLLFVGQAGDTNNQLLVGRLTTSGKLDSSFAGTGIAIVQNTPQYNWYAGAVALLSTGKIIMTGMYNTETVYAALKVFCYNTNGTQDNTFNDTGTFAYSTSPSGGESANSIFIQADDKILLSGSSNGGLLVIKLKSTGQADSSFNTTGIYRQAGGGVGNNIFTRPDGKLIVATNVYTVEGQGGQWNYGATQLNANGTPDATFANNGSKVISVSGLDHQYDAVLQPDGALIMVGYANELSLTTLVKITTNGSTDNSFGNNGIKILQLLGTDESVSGLLVQPDKKIIAAGSKSIGVIESSTIAFARYKANGSLDSSFGTAGKTTYFNNNIYYKSMALQSTGRLIVNGTIYNYNANTFNNIVFRLNSDGSADNSFGTSSQFVSPNLNPAYQVTNICTLTDNRILTCQNLTVEDGGYITVTRLTSNGLADNSFGNNGTVALQTGADNYVANTLALQPDGKILITAQQNLGDTAAQCVLIRLAANGVLDNSFGAGGIKTLPVLSFLNEGNIPVMVLPDGKIIVGATAMDYNTEEIATSIFRLNSNGTADLSFNKTGNFSLPNSEIISLALQQDSSIYAAFQYPLFGTNISFLMRIKSNGTADSSIDYANNGVLQLDNNWMLNNLIALPDSTILLGGGVNTYGSKGNYFLLASYKKLRNSFRFIGNGNWTITTNWEDGRIPPSVLPPQSYIYIQPAAGGKCILNTTQHISSDNSIIVGEGKNLVITGGLFINH